MGKALEISFPDRGVAAEFDLFERQAPRTVQGIWDATPGPYSVPCYHAIFSGQEVFWYMENALPEEVPLENHSWRCDPGDLFYFHMPAGRLRPRGQTPELQGSGEVHELAIPYGLADFQIMTLDGWRGAVVGRIRSNHDAFYAACGSILDEGVQNISVRRVED